MENGNGVNKKKMRKVLYVYIAVILVLVFFSRTIYNFSLPRVTVVMAHSGWITKELEVRSIVEFSETIDIFARSSGWVDEVFVSSGDFVDIDTIIAKYNPVSNSNEKAALLINIERTEHQLTRLNIQRADAQNNLNRLGYMSSDEVQRLLLTMDDATINVERNRNRHVAELNNAQTSLWELEYRGYIFDDFTYSQAVQEASINLERRAIDLKNAESNLDDIRRSRSTSFDARSYQNAISAAQTNRQRNQIAYESAQQQLNMAWQRFYSGEYADWTEVTAAQSNVASARLNLDESDTLLEQASSNLQISRNNFNEQNREQQNQAVTEAEALVVQAENNLYDATRTYENAKTVLYRAESNAIAQWQYEILEAENRISKAVFALEDGEWEASQNLRQVETNLELAQMGLHSQMEEARRMLELELRDINLDIERTQIDLRADQSALASISKTDTINIMSNRQGIVVDIDKAEGQFISQGERITTIGINNNRFIIEFSSPLSEAGFIEVGSIANVYKSGSNIAIPALVYNITPEGDTLNIRLVAETNQFNSGEFVRVHFRIQTGPHQTIVPSDAVFIGAMGQHYIWTIQSRHGTLGTEYISVRRSVRVIDSDDFNTAIYMSWMEMNMAVITTYSSELSVNGRVSRME